MSVIQVTDATFEREVVASPLPVLIDLYADWCGPCRQMAPVIEELAAELEGRLKTVKIDIDANPLCAQTFQASSIPMFVVMKDGKVVGQQLGAVPKSVLRRLVEPALGPDEAAVDARSLEAMLEAGEALAVDLRDPSAYGRFRIPGAINLPAAELGTRKDELRADDGRVRVLYGRADEAAGVARQLAAEGFDVRYLDEGFLGWESAGLRVERG